jgi:pimeloyl-ACP methyl ester carboxylesterase
MRRPGLVRSLVLIEPPVLTLFTSDPPKPMELFSLLVTRPRTALAIAHFGATGVEPANDALRRGDVDGALERHAIAVLGPDAFRNLSPARLAQARANFIEAELLGSGFPPVDPQEIRALKVPVLLVNGEKSPRMFHCFVDRLCELLPHARRIQIPDASHIVHEDAPEALTAAVRSFLSTPR